MPRASAWDACRYIDMHGLSFVQWLFCALTLLPAPVTSIHASYCLVTGHILLACVNPETATNGLLVCPLLYVQPVARAGPS